MKWLSSATAILRSVSQQDESHVTGGCPLRGCHVSSMRYTSVAWRGAANKVFKHLFVLLFLLLLGCSSSGKLDVSLLNASHNESFDQELNKTTDTISFIISNNEDFSIDCSVILQLSNGTNSSSKTGKVGLLNPAEQKLVSLRFEMFEGKTDLSIKPDCQAK